MLKLGLREWKGDGYMQWTYSELTMAIIWKCGFSKLVVRMKQKTSISERISTYSIITKQFTIIHNQNNNNPMT